MFDLGPMQRKLDFLNHYLFLLHFAFYRLDRHESGKRKQRFRHTRFQAPDLEEILGACNSVSRIFFYWLKINIPSGQCIIGSVCKCVQC